MRKSEIDRFVSKIEFREDGCWIWHGTKRRGYGAFHLTGSNKMVGAHRYAFVLFGDSLVAGYVLDHLCSILSCVNPEHLQQVKQKVNVGRGRHGVAARPECIHGHPFTERNTFSQKRNKGYVRICRTCSRARTARSRIKAKNASHS